MVPYEPIRWRTSDPCDVKILLAFGNQLPAPSRTESLNQTIKDIGMKQRLNSIRDNAITVREGLSGDHADNRRLALQLDRIIRGTNYVQWMHRIAIVFFVLFAAFFVTMVYPSTTHMLTILGFAVGGYVVCLLGILFQMKLYERTIAKAKSLPQQQTA